MKYRYNGETIPQESRDEINQKILYLIDNDSVESSGITPEDIYNAYTGVGGLHGLKYSDYKNRYEYTEAKREIENGQFFTPAAVCQFIMDCLSLDGSALWADLTCGMGNFFNFAPVEENVYGRELDTKAYKVAHYLYPAANITCGDIRGYDPGVKLDYVVGNPPFHLKWYVDGSEIVSQLYYCQKAAELLKPFGIMAIVVPASFLADDFMDKGYISEMEKHFSFLGQVVLNADTFSALGVTEYPTKIMFWQKLSEVDGWTPKPYKTDCMNIPLDETGVQTVRGKFIVAAQDTLNRNKSHILLELARSHDSSAEFTYQVRKYLWVIQSHPALKERYARACEYVDRYYTQKMPEGMSYEEWQKVRLTEAKVLAYLKSTVRKQHKPVYKDEIRLVRSKYTIRYKAYSPKAERRMTADIKMQTPVYQIILDSEADEYKPYSRALRRKEREYKAETKPFSEMEQDSAIAKWLDDFSLYDMENDKTICLNALQKSDLNLVLQKRNALLQWEQGSGKTLAGIAYGKYRMENCNTAYTWVISNAICIKNNWSVVLPNYGIPFVRVERLCDLSKIKRGDFALITLNMVCKYQKHLKRWMKSHKVTLVFDESDEISNPTSKRTKAVLDVFRRVKYKLLMTGTSTRNNISEFFPQLELAYNNSCNMISWADCVYFYDKKYKNADGHPLLTTGSNNYYGMPIPAYRPGYRLFSESHLPEKITVFGVGQKTQDIYNADVLSDILDRFVITRTFEEVSGKDIKRIHQVPVRFTEAEKDVYNKTINEFSVMCRRYFASTGNSRKDAMLRLIRQITLLLRISAAPNTVDEYTGGTPAKILKVLDMLADMQNEIVAIGVRHKIVVDAYASAIRERFPNRPLFIVTGDRTTFAQRRKLRKTLKDSGNGILLCTQQSLPSSVNFEYVDKCIIPELHYNNSAMSQFYFRFIRYTSEMPKDVYFVTYHGSIEANQMQMVLAKEKLNLFMKGQDAELDEIYSRFGVDYNLLASLMRREQGDEGNFYIRWGEQTIV